MMSEFDIILATITHPAAYAIDLFAMLDICRMEDGRYAVTEEWQNGQWLFDDPRLAVEFFLKKRAELQLGFDYEIGLLKKETEKLFRKKGEFYDGEKWRATNTVD